MHNGGVYSDNLESKIVQDFGAQGPYSLFGEVETLQSGSSSSYTKHNNYHAPDGHAFVVPSMKSNLGPSAATVLPNAIVRFPFPTTQQGPVNDSATAVGSNPPDTGDSIIRTSRDIATINLNNGGELLCFWVNRINPDLPASATTSQKLQITFVMEITMECDVKINYTPELRSLNSIPLFNDGLYTQGKVAAMPCQAPWLQDYFIANPAYWAFGDALRPTHKNNL